MSQKYNDNKVKRVEDELTNEDIETLCGLKRKSIVTVKQSFWGYLVEDCS